MDRLEELRKNYVDAMEFNAGSADAMEYIKALESALAAAREEADRGWAAKEGIEKVADRLQARAEKAERLAGTHLETIREMVSQIAELRQGWYVPKSEHEKAEREQLRKDLEEAREKLERVRKILAEVDTPQGRERFVLLGPGFGLAWFAGQIRSAITD